MPSSPSSSDIAPHKSATLNSQSTEGFVGVSCLNCENGAEYVPCQGPGPGWTYEDSSGWLCPDCTRQEIDTLRREVRDLEHALADEKKLRRPTGGNGQRDEENVVIIWLEDRDAAPTTDRLTLRMAARDLISHVDEHRRRRAGV